MFKLFKSNTADPRDVAIAGAFITSKIKLSDINRLNSILAYYGALSINTLLSGAITKTQKHHVLDVLVHYYLFDATETGIHRNHYHILINTAYGMGLTVLDVDRAIHRKAKEKKKDEQNFFSQIATI